MYTCAYKRPWKVYLHIKEIFVKCEKHDLAVSASLQSDDCLGVTFIIPDRVTTPHCHICTPGNNTRV